MHTETSSNQKNKYNAIKYVTYYDLPPLEITKTAKPKYSTPAFPAHAEVPLGFMEILDSQKAAEQGPHGTV